MHGTLRRTRRRLWLFAVAAVPAAVVAAICAGAASSEPAAITKAGPAKPHLVAKVTKAAAFDVSRPLRELAKSAAPATFRGLPPERGPTLANVGHTTDGALQRTLPAPSIPGTLANFEGLSNQDNFNTFGFRVNPPDPNGEVGPNNYVEMINLVFGVYNKAGTLLLGPVDTGTLWSGFSIPDCTDPSGDPVVLYDQFSDRWILTQFTTAGPEYYNCIAISTTGDPTGSYYRYAFSTGLNFPDYPKYGNWTDSYVITTREFGPTVEYGIGVYALEKNKMLVGDPTARDVSFFIDGNDPDLLPLVGDGLLPADVDGKQKPKTDSAIPLVGTQDDGGGYGATFDALNIWDLTVKWRSTPLASLMLNAQLPTASFDSIFPCAPTARDCLPQPGITDPAQFLDILSYRQRPLWRLQYRNFGTHETLVTNQSVEARPGVAGVRWWELRNPRNAVLHQEGTWAPNDGINRWMGSVALDKQGNLALGYSVVNATNVFPGIRYAGRLNGDPLGQLTQAETVLQNGSGVQTTTNSRWGDYTSMSVDPQDGCTFWYMNEYYARSGTTADPRPWQTRIGAFKFPGCV
jgi:hypothetical protein